MPARAKPLSVSTSCQCLVAEKLERFLERAPFAGLPQPPEVFALVFQMRVGSRGTIGGPLRLRGSVCCVAPAVCQGPAPVEQLGYPRVFICLATAEPGSFIFLAQSCCFILQPGNLVSAEWDLRVGRIDEPCPKLGNLSPTSLSDSVIHCSVKVLQHDMV